MSAMEVMGILVEKLGTKFKSHLSTSKCQCTLVNTMCALIRITTQEYIFKYMCVYMFIWMDSEG